MLLVLWIEGLGDGVCWTEGVVYKISGTKTNNRRGRVNGSLITILPIKSTTYIPIRSPRISPLQDQDNVAIDTIYLRNQVGKQRKQPGSKANKQNATGIVPKLGARLFGWVQGCRTAIVDGSTQGAKHNLGKNQ